MNAKDEDGWTPLHKAATFGNLPIAKLLIGEGANVNAKTEDGETPLDYAYAAFAVRRDPAMVKFLIDFQSPSRLDAIGISP